MRSESQKYWLTFTGRNSQQPIIWKMSATFKLVFDIRLASIRHGIGLVALEIRGPRSRIRKAVQWLERKGVKVEPLEMAIIEG